MADPFDPAADLQSPEDAPPFNFSDARHAALALVVEIDKLDRIVTRNTAQVEANKKMIASLVSEVSALRAATRISTAQAEGIEELRASVRRMLADEEALEGILLRDTVNPQLVPPSRK